MAEPSSVSQKGEVPPPSSDLPWPTDQSMYRLVSKIGQGAFATVYKAIAAAAAAPPPRVEGQAEQPERECAIKVLNLDHCETNLVEIRQEVQAMRLSAHPNILKVHTAFVADVNLWLVTPLMKKGSSLHLLQTARRILKKEQIQIPLQHMENHIVYILHQALTGLQYIHSQGQIHRDMKGGNILLDHQANVLIADFGVSGWLIEGGERKEQAKTFVGTPCWMAPEVMEQVHGYDYKADIWSVGITALELAKGYAPYAKYPPMKVLILTIQEDPPSLDTYNDEEADDINVTTEEEEGWSKSFRALIAQCLEKDPSKRPTCDELLATKFLSNMDVEERREALKTELCDLIPDIGIETSSSSSAGDRTHLPGNAPVSIILSQQEDDRPAGTTWVFADGSQVLASTQTEGAEEEDVFNELDQFGENYTRESQEPSPLQEAINDAVTNSDAAEIEKEKDDLNDFMDEFELTTGGENFRKS